MIFRDSCVTQVSPYSCTEESTAVPRQIFPAYIGTGNTVLSLDASGLQSLNHGVQEAFGAMPGSGDMYVVSHGMMSDILSADNAHPYGYFTWEFEREGEWVGPENLVSQAAVWKRRLYLDQGRAVTSMILLQNTRLELDVAGLLGTNRILMRVRLKSYHRSNQKSGKEIPAKFRIRLHLATRSGEAACRSPQWDNMVLKASYPGRQDYEIRIGAYSSDAEKSFDGNCLTLEFTPQITDEWQEAAALFDFAADEQAIPSESSDFSRYCAGLFLDNWKKRRERYASLAEFHGLDDKQTFLYHNTLYLIYSCFSPSYGYPIGFPFYFPWCWRCSTFWDSTFLMDGIMRLGDSESSKKFLQFLYQSMNREGKPFSWMFAYDGRSTVDDDRDIAPLVMCAHAMTAIRHYEYFQDLETLRSCGYPILERVAQYAAEELFSRDEQGRWYLSIPVSNDVVEEQAREINQTFTLVWFLTIFRKCVEYGRLFGKEHPLLEEITGNFRIEQDETEYFHSQGIRAGEHNCASWIVFLLFPTEGMPFLDLEKLNRTRKKYSWEELYMDLQGCYQPWTEMMQGCSDLRRGDAEEGYRMFQLGLSHTFGPGYFSEIGPMQETVGLPPYISAYGTFLNYLASLYVTTDIWDGRLGVFTSLPAELSSKAFQVEGLRCNKGLTLSAARLPGRLEVKLAGRRPGLQVECLLPSGLDLSDAELYINGYPHCFEVIDRRRKILRFQLDLDGTAEFVIQ